MTGPIASATADGLVRATLNRPERGNALDEASVEALIAIVEQASRESTRVLVLEGAGRHFCTGFDLPEQGADDAQLLYRLVRIEILLQLVYRAPFVTVAVAHGRTFGAGADLFTACTQRITLGDASFAFPGAGFGILLGTRRLCECVGVDATRRLVRTGQAIGAEEALHLNLANQSCERDGVEALVADAARIEIDAPTLSDLNRATARSDDDKALADLVRSAGRPGLADRLAAYREKVRSAKRR